MDVSCISDVRLGELKAINRVPARSEGSAPAGVRGYAEEKCAYVCACPSVEAATVRVSMVLSFSRDPGFNSTRPKLSSVDQKCDGCPGCPEFVGQSAGSNQPTRHDT